MIRFRRRFAGEPLGARFIARNVVSEPFHNHNVHAYKRRNASWHFSHPLVSRNGSTAKRGHHKVGARVDPSFIGLRRQHYSSIRTISQTGSDELDHLSSAIVSIVTVGLAVEREVRSVELLARTRADARAPRGRRQGEYLDQILLDEASESFHGSGTAKSQLN